MSRREVDKGRIDMMVWISMHFIITPVDELMIFLNRHTVIRMRLI